MGTLGPLEEAVEEVVEGGIVVGVVVKLWLCGLRGQL